MSYNKELINVPDIGRIPHTISYAFSSFTADQYKNWIIYFSLISLSWCRRGMLEALCSPLQITATAQDHYGAVVSCRFTINEVL